MPIDDVRLSMRIRNAVTAAGLKTVGEIWKTSDASERFFSLPRVPDMPDWMELSARLGHWMIYALLVLAPPTILGAWLEGHPLTVLGFRNIQPWVPQSGNRGWG